MSFAHYLLFTENIVYINRVVFVRTQGDDSISGGHPKFLGNRDLKLLNEPLHINGCDEE